MAPSNGGATVVSGGDGTTRADAHHVAVGVERQYHPGHAVRYGGTGGVSDIFSGRRREERGVPRRISLGPDDDKPKEAEKTDEQNLSEEELLARKLADLKKKLEGGG